MAKKRGRETAYDMVLSLGAVFIAVAVVLVVTWRPKHQSVAPVDYANAKSLALTAANWPVLNPTQLPADYQVTSARFEAESYGEPGDSRWYLGLTSSDQKFISLWQSDGFLKDIQSAATNAGKCSTVISINGQDWTKCEAQKPETRSLVRKSDDLIYIVSGTADWNDLTDFAESLETLSR